MIPVELRALKQWCWASLAPLANGKADKAPRTATGALASVGNPATWGTYDEIAAKVERDGGAAGLILTPNEPYTVIDLDHTEHEGGRQAQSMVWDAFKDVTFVEYSQSGKGVHIICRATVGGGIRRPGVEVYDRARFIICTGNVLVDLPIADCSALVTDLVTQMGGVDAPGMMPESGEEERTDEEILAAIRNSANADKFNRLYTNPPGDGDDWSALDAALAQFIAYYTDNHEQALRLFRGSVLYNPERKAAKSGYKSLEAYEQGYLLGRTFKVQWQHKAREQEQWQKLVDHGREQWAQVMATEHGKQREALDVAMARADNYTPDPATDKVAQNSIPRPPGLVGDVAAYVYETSPSPVWEIAVAVALTFCSAVFGNKWRTPTGNPLGHFTVLLAESGTGKSAAAARITALVRDMEEKSPLITEMSGPGYIASGQGMLKRFAEQPVMYSYLTEFDATLKRLDPSIASDSYIEFRRVLLEVFDSDRIQATAYAKKDDGTDRVEYPVFSFLGDTRAEDFFDLVNDQFARSGFLARLTLIEYTGGIPKRPANYLPWVPQDLVQRMSDATLACYRQPNGVANVQFDIPAGQRFDELGSERVEKMNNATDQLTRGAWNRMDLRVVRLATVIAVGCNPLNPIVTVDHMQWAEGIIRWGLDRIIGDRVTSDSIGTGDARFVGDVVEFVKWYQQASPAQRRSKKAPRALEENGKVLPYPAFKHFVSRRERYYGYRRGGLDGAVKQALTEAQELGILDQMTTEQCREVGYSGRVPIFMLGEHWSDYDT